MRIMGPKFDCNSNDARLRLSPAQPKPHSVKSECMSLSAYTTPRRTSIITLNPSKIIWRNLHLPAATGPMTARSGRWSRNLPRVCLWCISAMVLSNRCGLAWKTSSVSIGKTCLRCMEARRTISAFRNTPGCFETFMLTSTHRNTAFHCEFFVPHPLNFSVLAKRYAAEAELADKVYTQCHVSCDTNRTPGSCVFRAFGLSQQKSPGLL